MCVFTWLVVVMKEQTNLTKIIVLQYFCLSSHSAPFWLYFRWFQLWGFPTNCWLECCLQVCNGYFVYLFWIWPCLLTADDDSIWVESTTTKINLADKIKGFCLFQKFFWDSVALLKKLVLFIYSYLVARKKLS